jgi:hypothetical protein
VSYVGVGCSPGFAEGAVLHACVVRVVHVIYSHVTAPRPAKAGFPEEIRTRGCAAPLATTTKTVGSGIRSR